MIPFPFHSVLRSRIIHFGYFFFAERKGKEAFSHMTIITDLNLKGIY